MTVIGTPFTDNATRVMLLGSGELGREVALELIRYGCEVIAVDRYAHAPAMQVAQHSHVINMLDGAALRALVEQEKPALIVPEIEAIATDELVKLEAEGYTVVPHCPGNPVDHEPRRHSLPGRRRAVTAHFTLSLCR